MKSRIICLQAWYFLMTPQLHTCWHRVLLYLFYSVQSPFWLTMWSSYHWDECSISNTWVHGFISTVVWEWFLFVSYYAGRYGIELWLQSPQMHWFISDPTCRQSCSICVRDFPSSPGLVDKHTINLANHVTCVLHIFASFLCWSVWLICWEVS